MLLSILSGVLCGLAFTNPSFFWLVYFALVPFLGVILAAKRAGRVFFAALFFALPFFGIVLWWMNELFAYAYFFANFAYFSLILYESLFLVGFGLTFYNLKKLKFIPYPLIAAAAFVVFEYLRSLGTFGITAGGLGYSQTAFLPMVQLARFFGSYGITFFIVLVNALLLSILVSKKGRLLKIALLIILISANYLFGSLLIKDYDAKLPEKSVKVAVIQGNIPQAVKLSNRNYNYYFDLYRKLSLKAHLLRPSIYVWPETALNNFIARRPIFGKLSNLAEELNAALIVGAPQRVERQYFNVAFCIGKDGKLKGVYQKQHLVPFGEYLPWRKVLYPVLSATGLHEADYSPGKGPGVISLNGEKVGLMICFESTFPYIARERVKDGADFLLTLTNDAWFNNSYALTQHMQAGILRAVETGKYFVQSSNTGISFAADGAGRVIDQSVVNREAYLVFNVKNNPQATFYTKYGDLFVCACGIIVIILLLGHFLFREEEKKV